ncbi:HAD family hydrolase [Enterococcus sp. BWB1-3]|uniref:HAD family hydrolase n=1 Tax=unclassified Enterococcus TaxID=2608891 RepID=UPI0019242E31|nr:MULTISPECIES: HAD family hydrolase [unclassified Enterococcus]MBL1229772.1 HAD family hydrolase [Enterococcus sp. BWB1-3]MCB5956270.1 HAD family hydrolase [Enterococcus sp. CWB-B31]
MLKSVVFDVDDTVYDQQVPFYSAVKKIFPTFPNEEIPKFYIRFRHHSDSVFEKTTSGEWSLAIMRFYRLAESLKDFGWSSLTEKESCAFQQVYEDELGNIQMHPEIVRVFDYLKGKQIPLGIITNGPTDHQYKKIKQLKIEAWIPSDNIFISQSTGFQKPQKEIFDLTAKQMQLDPQTALYIGDSFENDVVGAHNAGWHSLWLNHRLRDKPKNTEASSLKELTSFDKLFDTVSSFI